MSNACWIGVDIGGTRIKMGVVDELGGVSQLQNVATSDNRESIYATIEEYVGQRPNVQGVGLSMPGIIDKRGFTVTSGAVKSLKNRMVRDELEERLGLPAAVSNDGRAAALAEGWIGAARGIADYVVITLGTAIGGGIVLDGKLRSGFGGIAGEFGVALADLATSDYKEHAFALHAATVAGLCRRYSETVGEHIVDAQEIFRRADAGDVRASAAIDAFYQAVAIMCLNIAVTIAPEIIVVGGGISKSVRAMSDIQARYCDIIAGYPVLTTLPMPKVVAAHCHNDAGLVGAVHRLRTEQA